MREISQFGMNLNTGVSVSVETQGEAKPSWSSTTTSVVEKLDRILSQTIVNDDKVIEMVERVKNQLIELQNIANNLKSTNERENVWLEEVKEVCNYTQSVATNFILGKERWSKMGWLKKVVYLPVNYASENQFKKKMKYIRTQIEDALHRSFTFGVGGQERMGDNKQTTIFPVEIIPEVISVGIEFVLYVYIPDNVNQALLFFNALIPVALNLVVKSGRGEENSNKERRRIAISKLVARILIYSFINYMLIIIVSQFLPVRVALLFQLIIPFYDVIVWIVKLWRSLNKNLKCTQRYLALMHAFLNDTTESVTLNERQKVWVGQVRAVTQNGQSLIAFPTPTAGCLSRRIMFPKDIECLLKEILNISHRKTIYGIDAANIQQQKLVPAAPPPPPVASSSTSSYRRVTGLKHKVLSIRGEKELMDALFVDAGEMEGELDGRSRIWVQQMRDISNEIASVLNDYNAKLEHELILKYFFKCKTRSIIRKKIDDILNKIEDASRRRKAYGMVQFQTRAADTSSSTTVQILRGRTQLPLVAKESRVIGFDDEAHVLMAQLLSDEKRRCITWIVGIGGTGKTTLAKLIFEDKTVADHFECQVWVSSCKPAQRLLQQIANQITPDSSFSSSSDVLQTLAHKKYLIVIDGIEETSKVILDTLLSKAIPDMSTGSRLLLTTRKTNLAHQYAADTTFVHPLQLLDDETSWVLFTRHLKVDSPLEEELVKVGREIMMKCGGLPSQILKMSCLLSDATLTLEEWSSVLGRQQFNEDQKQSWSETLKTINTDLPLYLRRCLSYLGLFPSEFGIPVRRLVVLWVAESLVHHAAEQEQDQEPPEHVAERYLTELIDRNLIQIAKRKHNGKVKTCRLPYALRQFWWTKANESIFLKPDPATYSNSDPKNSIIRWVTDHLNTNHICYDHIHGDADSTRNDSASLRTYYKDVRSFLSFDAREGSKPGQEIGNFMKVSILADCFLLLRVLDLERVYKPKLPKTIARLSQLRYLGLRWTYLESLPSFISKLLKLQTLDLKHTYIHTLPTSIWEMELRHLFLSETFHSRFPPQQKDRFSLIRFLLPQRRDNFLQDLQTLWGLFVDEETPVKNGLDTLVNITKLGLACQQMSLEQEAMTKQLDTVADWIAKLEQLQSLRLKSRDEKGKPWILCLKSFRNNVNLTDMYLLGKLSSSSILSQFPNSLVELTLSHSKLEKDPMQLLKELSNLQTLCLLADSYVGQTMHCQAQKFPQLHVLKLWVLQQLEEWIIEPGALPCLRQLEIRSCSQLKMLPYGLMNVNTLLELKLTNMQEEINVDAHKYNNILPNCQVVIN
ncbi:putative disease resistance RPP13-like protein 2 [Cicer arietinum]